MIKRVLVVIAMIAALFPVYTSPASAATCTITATVQCEVTSYFSSSTQYCSAAGQTHSGTLNGMSIFLAHDGVMTANGTNSDNTLFVSQNYLDDIETDFGVATDDIIVWGLDGDDNFCFSSIDSDNPRLFARMGNGEDLVSGGYNDDIVHLDLCTTYGTTAGSCSGGSDTTSNDYAETHQGVDILFGGAGYDRMTGGWETGSGPNTFDGGAGWDWCYHRRGGTASNCEQW